MALSNLHNIHSESGFCESTFLAAPPCRTCKILHMLSPPGKPALPRPARRDVLQRGIGREVLPYAAMGHTLTRMAFSPEPPRTPSPCQAHPENRASLMHFQAPTKRTTALTDSTSCKGEIHKSCQTSPFCCRTSLFTRPATFESSRGFGASRGGFGGRPSCEGVPQGWGGKAKGRAALLVKRLAP
jgi:hypothetical protein